MNLFYTVYFTANHFILHRTNSQTISHLRILNSFCGCIYLLTEILLRIGVKVSLLPLTMNKDQKFIDEYLSTDEGAFACNLCQSFKRSEPYPVKNHTRQVHFGHAVKFNGNKFWSNCNYPICKKWCTSNKRSHYNCFHCAKIFTERASLVAHFQKLSDDKSVDTAVIASVKTDAELVNLPKKITELTMTNLTTFKNCLMLKVLTLLLLLVLKQMQNL